MPRARILSVGTAHPPQRYTQEEILARFPAAEPAVRRMFASEHVRSRYLYLPEPTADGRPHETMAQLLQKHRRGALEMGEAAIGRALSPLRLTTKDVDYLCVISSTGFMLPGLSAMFLRHLGFRTDCHRADIVGMGCNAGLNGLNPTSSWAVANPGRLALMVCCEVNSALYVDEPSVTNAVVNSLFGDGCAAITLRAPASPEEEEAPQRGRANTPTVLGFASHIIPETWDAMHYRWREEHNKFGFELARDVPYVLGVNAHLPVEQLLGRFGLRKRHISHWMVHSGGRKVIDAIKYTVGITEHDVRHTVAVLREMGNLGSGSFLFSLERLQAEGVVRRGDYGIMMTMGPGSTIETALIRW